MNDRAPAAKFTLSQEDIDKILGTIDLPPCPAIVTEVMTEARRDEPDLNRLAEIFARDPGMSAAAIKLANSVLFCGGAPVANVRRALDRLGTRNVVSIIVAAALRTSLGGQETELVERYWHRASGLATASGLVARRVYGLSPDLAYLYGLFRDAAVPVLIRRFPDYLDTIETGTRQGLPRDLVEAAAFPCTHADVGYLLVHNWKLPDEIGQAIRFHHDRDAYALDDDVLPEAALALIAAAHVGDHLISQVLGADDGELDEALFAKAQAHLGIRGEDMDDLREAVEAALSETA